jgi:hypothetical protein
VGGFSYEAFIRLVQFAGRYWRDIDGSCARRGIDPLALSPARFCHLILDWIREHSKPEDWDMIEGEIFAPFLDGRDPDAVPESVIEEEMSLFSAFTRQNQAIGG